MLLYNIMYTQQPYLRQKVRSSVSAKSAFILSRRSCAAETYLRIQLGVVLIQFFASRGMYFSSAPTKVLPPIARWLSSVSEDVNPLVHKDSELVLHI